MTVNTSSWPEELKGFSYSAIFFPHILPFPRIVWWGWEVNPKNYSNKNEEKFIYDAIHFHYIINGELTLNLNGTSRILTPGDAYIITTPTIYSFSQHGNTTLEMLGCYIYGSSIASFASKIANQCDNIIHLTPEHPALHNILQLAKYMVQMQLTHQEIENENCVSYAMNFLLELNREVKKYNHTADKYPVINALKYILTNHSKQITIRHIADSIMVSPNYFISIFKNKTGYSPAQFLTKIRLYLSIRSINESSNTLNDIAKKYGFKNPVKFCHSCQKHLSLTPKEASKLSIEQLSDIIWPTKLPGNYLKIINQHAKIVTELSD